MLDVVATFHEKEGDGDGVRNVQKYYASGNHAIPDIPR